MAKDAFYRRSKQTISKTLVDGKRSVLRMDDLKHFFEIDGWASEYWHLADGHRSQAEITDEICKQSKLERSFVEKQVAIVTKDLVKFGLLEKVTD